MIVGRPQGFAPTVIFQSFLRKGDPHGRQIQGFTLFKLLINRSYTVNDKWLLYQNKTVEATSPDGMKKRPKTTMVFFLSLFLKKTGIAYWRQANEKE